MIGFQEGPCRICNKMDVLNEGICADHSDDAAQGYLFGFADGVKSANADLIEAAKTLQSCVAHIRKISGFGMLSDRSAQMTIQAMDDTLAAIAKAESR